MLLPELTRSEATDAFERHHHRNALSPTNIVAACPTAAVTLVLCPFWAFSVAASATFTAEVGHSAAGAGTIDWRRCEPARLPPFRLPFSDPAVLVAASFGIRRDLVDGLEPMVSEALAEHTSGSKAPRGSRATLRSGVQLPIGPQVLQDVARAAGVASGDVRVEPLAMKQSVAWQLAVRGIRHAQVRAPAAL